MFTLTFVIFLARSMAPWNYKTNRNTCKKNPLLYMLKYFKIMLNIFEFSHVKEFVA